MMTPWHKAATVAAGTTASVAALVLSRLLLPFETETIHLAIVLVPLLVWLFVSGRLREITGPGGIGLVLADAVQRTVQYDAEDQPVDVQYGNRFVEMVREGDIVTALETGAILKRREVVLESATVDATNRDVLSMMEAANASLIPVAGDTGQFLGVVRQEDVVWRVLTKVVIQA